MHGSSATWLAISLATTALMVFAGCGATSSGTSRDPVSVQATDTATGPMLKLLYPRGGESFMVGQAVTIDWDIHSPQVTSVLVEMSIDTGKTYFALGPAVTPLEATSMDWVVGSEGATYPAPLCYLRISDYSVAGLLPERSGRFAVVN